VPLWPRIDRKGQFGTEAWSSAKVNPDDGGGISTRAMRDILRTRAKAARIPVDGVLVDEFREEQASRSTTTPHAAA
jgi:hypothetical protein